MFPRPFEYSAPRSLKEALALVRQHGDEARLLAGGQSLIPMMKLRFLDPAHVIDLRWIPELRGIEVRDDEIRCGAMVRHCDMERSVEITGRIPLLHKAAGEIADVQVRNRGTLGGALCQADPAGDWAVAALALGASMRCVDLEGERIVDAGSFFKDTYTPEIAAGEILVDVLFPIPPTASEGVYVKIRKRAGDFGIASVALQVLSEPDGRCVKVGLGIGGVAATPVSPRQVVECLTGRVLTAQAIDDACAILDKHIDPIEDLRGSVSYKRRLAGVALERALRGVVEQRNKRT